MQNPANKKRGGNLHQNRVMIPDKKGWFNTKTGFELVKISIFYLLKHREIHWVHFTPLIFYIYLCLLKKKSHHLCNHTRTFQSGCQFWLLPTARPRPFSGWGFQGFTDWATPEAYTVAEPLEPGISGRARCPHVWKVSKIPGKTWEGGRFPLLVIGNMFTGVLFGGLILFFLLQFLPCKPQQLGNKHVIQFDLEAYFLFQKGKTSNSKPPLAGQYK